MSFTTVIVDFTAKPGMRDQLTAMLGEAIQMTIRKPDCFKAVLVTDDDDADRFAMVQEWRSADAHREYAAGLMGNPKMAAAMDLMALPPKSRYHSHHTAGGGDWGGPGHLELTSTDVEATKSFLTDVFDWRFEMWMDDYQGWWAPGAFMGGLRTAHEAEGGPGSTPYLVVNDFEARLEAVKAAGGTIIVPPQTIEHAGRFFVFAAPGGLCLAVWESASQG